MDTLTPLERSKRMSLVRGKDTTPELAVRRIAHGLGYRYRLHGAKLPGRPDMVFARRRKVVFVHGCFWHRHDERACALTRMPKSRVSFWRDKLEANRSRDARNLELLSAAGWKSLVIWECEIRDRVGVERRLKSFLGKP